MTLSELDNLLLSLARDDISEHEATELIREGSAIVVEEAKYRSGIPTSAGVDAVDACTSKNACLRVLRVLISSNDWNYLVNVATCTKRATTDLLVLNLVSSLKSTFVPSSEVSENNQRAERKCIYTTLEKVAKFKTFKESIAREVRPALSSAIDMEGGSGNQNMERVAALEAALKVWGGAGGGAEEVDLPQDKTEKESDLEYEDKKAGQDMIPDYTGGAPVADEGLVTAMPVQDDVYTSPAEVAKLVNMEDKKPFHTTRFFKIFAAGAICLASIVAITVPLAIIKPWEETKGTGSPTPNPTSQPTTVRGRDVGKSVEDVILGTGLYPKARTVFCELEDVTCPETLALKWIIDEDPQKLDGDSPNLLQRYALATLYFATGGDTHWYKCARNEIDTNCTSDDEGEKTRFLNVSDECSWYGITCEEDNGITTVSEIELVYNSLNGTLPVEIALLKSLSQLVLVGNGIGGTVPKQISELSDLTQLQMGENYFTGSLPIELYAIQSLEVISFYDNYLNGTIPAVIGGMRNLKGFWMFNNDLSGQIPNDIGQLSFLTYFDIKNNAITGTIPASFWQLNKLEYFDLGANPFAAWSFPESIASKSIDSFQASNCNLEGKFPDYFYDMTALQVVVLAGNDLSGPISESVNQLTKLETLDVSYNILNGTLPPSFSELTSLENLILRGNLFSGEVPASFENLKVSARLFLHYNPELSGSIHQNICNNTPTIIADCLDTFKNATVTCSCCKYCCDALEETCVEE